jgi:hypothetical protein
VAVSENQLTGESEQAKVNADDLLAKSATAMEK